jgi:WD40 repeat protein
MYHLKDFMDTNLPKIFMVRMHIMNFIVRANFGFNDNFLVSGSEDGFVYLWDLKKQKLVGTLGTKSLAFGHLNEVNDVATFDNNIVISASDDCSVIVWDLLN